MEVLSKKLAFFRKFLIASITVNVLWVIFLGVFIGTINLTVLALFLLLTVGSYVLAIVNGVMSLGFQRYLPMNTPGYGEAGTIKILGILCIVLGGRIIDIILLVLVGRLIDDIKTNPVYTEHKEENQMPH